MTVASQPPLAPFLLDGNLTQIWGSRCWIRVTALQEFTAGAVALSGDHEGTLERWGRPVPLGEAGSAPEYQALLSISQGLIPSSVT